jgi:hypothetical protein
MAGKSLVSGSTLQCPHGGSVSVSPTNSSVKADSDNMVLMSDTFTISGCSFQIPAAPSPIPSPCVQVQWVVPDTRVKINGTPTLSESSVGLCLAASGLPQGPVTVANTQQKVSSQ